MSPMSAGALWNQLELAKLGDTHKMTLVAFEEDEHLFTRLAPDGPPTSMFISVCLNNFQCALLRRLNMDPSQLHPNS